jgi:hypothetical protein
MKILSIITHLNVGDANTAISIHEAMVSKEIDAHLCV